MATKFKTYNVIVPNKKDPAQMIEIRRTVYEQGGVSYISYGGVLYVVNVDHWVESVLRDGDERLAQAQERVPVYLAVGKAVLGVRGSQNE